LHGDVLRTTTPSATLAPDGVGVWTDEYGRVLDATGSLTTGPRYGWLGGKQRATDTGATGLTLMGVRLYSPIIGRFLSTDPVYGGNANTYTYPVDPVNGYDLDGNYGNLPCWHGHCRRGDPSVGASDFWDFASIVMGVSAIGGCVPCGGIAFAINAGQFGDAVHHGDRAGAAVSAIGFVPSIGKGATRLMRLRNLGRLRSSYTNAGRALKSYRTSYRAGMARWDHRYHSWGRKLEYGAISVEAGRYARSDR